MMFASDVAAFNIHPRSSSCWHILNSCWVVFSAGRGRRTDLMYCLYLGQLRHRGPKRILGKADDCKIIVRIKRIRREKMARIMHYSSNSNLILISVLLDPSHFSSTGCKEDSRVHAISVCAAFLADSYLP
jgi:hypothetical protein